jgi:hypothetical protein
VRRKPQAKRQNRGGEQKNRKQNVNTLGKSHNGQGVAAKTANETANTWSRGTQNGQTIGQWLKTLQKLVKS